MPFDLPRRALGRAADGDLDPPRPHRLGHLALQLDDQQAVLEAGALHLHEVGEVEAPLEAARRETTVEVLPPRSVALWPETTIRFGWLSTETSSGAKPGTASVTR